MSAITETDDLRQELTMLARRVDAVEQRLAQNGVAASAASDLASVMADVQQITQELFPGKCEFTSEFDPEYPDDRYVVVNVEATGDLKGIAERGCIWDDRIRQLSENLFGHVRLLIVPR